MIDPFDIYNFIRNEYVGTEKTYASLKGSGTTDWLHGYCDGKQMALWKMMSRFLNGDEIAQILKEAEDGK